MSKLVASLLLSVLLLLAAASTSAGEEDALDLDGIMDAFGWDFDATQIRVEQVADNLYVLFGIGGNIGVSIGDQGTLIVDDQFPQMIPKIQAAIKDLLGGDPHRGNSIDFAINTHWHFDHAEGNLSLGPAGTWIVAQQNSRDMMQNKQIINLVAMKYRQQAYPAAALPVITYADRMQFHFNGEQIELLHFGPAHTTGDTGVYFRGSNAVHLGDVFNRGYPFIDADNGGGIEGMIAFCEAVLGEINKDTTVIPGHGEISDYNGLAAYISMLKTVRMRIETLLVAGKSLEEIAHAKPTADFDSQYGDPAGFIDRVVASLEKAH